MKVASIIWKQRARIAACFVLLLSFEESALGKGTVIKKAVHGRDILIPVPSGFELLCEKNHATWDAVSKGVMTAGENLITCMNRGGLVIIVNVNQSSLEQPLDEQQWAQYKLDTLKSHAELFRQNSSELSDLMNEVAEGAGGTDLDLGVINTKKPQLLYETDKAVVTLRKTSVDVNGNARKQIVLQAIMNIRGNVFTGGASTVDNEQTKEHQDMFRVWAKEFLNINSH